MKWMKLANSPLRELLLDMGTDETARAKLESSGAEIATLRTERKVLALSMVRSGGAV